MKSIDNGTIVAALGGLGEIGKNMYIFEHQDELVIVDAGVMFPEDELLGIDYVIQDVTYLKNNEKKIQGLIITHGHEDHIGGISFLLQNIKIPVIYAPKFAVDLIKNKTEDRNVHYDNGKLYDEKTHIKSKHFEIEFITVNHSIPDAYAVVIHTPNGTIVSTGDFKFDLTPIGPVADYGKMAEIGKRGVKLLMSESTNALSEGFSKSESTVEDSLGDIFARHHARIIIATFASNIYRIKHIVETCKKNNRKIIVWGRSMQNNIEIAREHGLIDSDVMFIEPNQAKDLKKNEICILCTGSQGEPLAAMSRIANGTHKQISLLPDDLVIFSSNPIPGNSSAINRIINKLYLKGVKVFTNSEFSDIHTSGHAKQDELKLMLRIIKPQFLMPMHGEYRMLKQHAKLGIDCDVPEDNIFILKNGETLVLDKNGIHKGPNIPAGDVYVDGSRVGDIGSVVIKDRKLMSKDGILVTILNINPITKELLIKPNVTTRGFVLVNENIDLIQKIERKILEIVTNYLAKNQYNYVDLRNTVILELNPFINELTGRRPIILPVIMEVRKVKESV